MADETTPPGANAAADACLPPADGRSGVGLAAVPNIRPRIVVRVDSVLRPLVPRLKRVVESYADFFRWALRDRNPEALSATLHDLRATARLFGMAAVLELCARLEWAVVAHMDDEAYRCVDQLCALMHATTFVFS